MRHDLADPREDTASRSAARQTTLSSNSLTSAIGVNQLPHHFRQCGGRPSSFTERTMTVEKR